MDAGPMAVRISAAAEIIISGELDLAILEIE